MIEIYGRSMCPACEAACNIAEQAGAFYNYYNIEFMDSEDIVDLMQRTDAKTVPIIIAEGRIIGDLDEFREYFDSRSPRGDSTTTSSARLG